LGGFGGSANELADAPSIPATKMAARMRLYITFPLSWLAPW
jgi:hypothetical protein